jgi:dephospho-CoA kinase
MLRVGLTGGLGSGKSTAAHLFAKHGAHILEADAIGRSMMQPGHAVYDAIVEHFGRGVLLPDGQLDRAALARLSFADGRVEELNAIVHPAVITEQAKLAAEIFARDQNSVVIVESALIFETKYSEAAQPHAEAKPEAPWRTRFDCLILITAPEEAKIERYIQRMAAGEPVSAEQRAKLTAEARHRLAQQIPDERKVPFCDFILHNNEMVELEQQVDELWPMLWFSSASNHKH